MGMNQVVPEFDYERLEKHLFTDAGQRLVIDVRDDILNTLKSYGAFRLREVIRNICKMDITKAIADETGATNVTISTCVVQRMIELGDIREVSVDPVLFSHGNRIFTNGSGI